MITVGSYFILGVVDNILLNFHKIFPECIHYWDMIWRLCVIFVYLAQAHFKVQRSITLK